MCNSNVTDNATFRSRNDKMEKMNVKHLFRVLIVIRIMNFINMNQKRYVYTVNNASPNIYWDLITVITCETRCNKEQIVW